MKHRILLAVLLIGALSTWAADPDSKGGFTKFAMEKMKESQLKNPMVLRLSKMMIPRLEMEDAAVKDVLAQLRVQAKEADLEGKGFNVFMRASADKLAATVSFELRDISVLDVLSLIEQTTEVSFVFEPYAVVVIDKPPAKE